MTDATEVWLPVVGYESTYAVSSLGRVRSIRANRDLKQASSGRGYRTVTLCVDSRPATRYVHHLVAAAFHGERPSGHDVCHNDGDLLNNSATNLRYDTRNGNMRDALKHGTHRSVGRTHCVNGHELTPESIYIRRTVSTDGAPKVWRKCKVCQTTATRKYLARLAA